MSLMGVVIVTYNSADQILDCLDSLLASDNAHRLRITLVDNASADETVAKILDWSDGRVTEDLPATRLSHPVTLLRQSENLGFAAGANVGLKLQLRDPEICRFWLLNPDTIVPPQTPSRLMSVQDDFAMMGNRICYADGTNRIQLDAGKIDTRSGVTRNINIGQDSRVTPAPKPSEIDFISGASLVVSRAFLKAAGPMREDYFLYYEEVDWALRRKNMPLIFCDHAEVFHVAGASIGSPSLERQASLTSLYHKHRSRMIFLWRWYPKSIPFGLLYGIAKAAQASLRQGWRAGLVVLAGIFGCRNPFARSIRPAISASSDKSVS